MGFKAFKTFQSSHNISHGFQGLHRLSRSDFRECQRRFRHFREVSIGLLRLGVSGESSREFRGFYRLSGYPRGFFKENLVAFQGVPSRFKAFRSVGMRFKIFHWLPGWGFTGFQVSFEEVSWEV